MKRFIPLLMLWMTVAKAASGEMPFSVTPVVQYVAGSGDDHKFQEDWQTASDWLGGVEDASYIKTDESGWQVNLTGRAIFPDEDFRVQLELAKPEIGFVRAEWKQYRRYYDDTGGFYAPFTTTSFDLNRDLFVDIGSFSIEFGLTLPDLPRIVVGYEYRYKDGTKSMIEWGSVSEAGTTRKIYPATKAINEDVHIFKAEVDHTFRNIRIADQFRYEYSSINGTRLDDAQLTLPATAPAKTVTVNESYQQDAFFNTFLMDSHLNEKVYWSLGYLFSTLDGTPDIQLITTPSSAASDRNWTIESASLDQDSHVLNLNLFVGPFAGLYLCAGLQLERTETDGASNALLTTPGGAPEVLINSSRTQEQIEENLGLRYMKIPHTTLYAEGRWTQGNTDLFERELEDGTLDGSEAFLRSTDTDVFRQRYTVGLNSAPLRRLSVALRARRTINDNDYDHDRDEKTTGGAPTDLNGYSAFITEQKFETDELSAKLTFRPSTRASISLQYQLVQTDFKTQHDAVPLVINPIPAGSLNSGQFDSQIYTLSATVTPITRLYVMGLVSYQDTQTHAADNDAASVATYRGNVWTAIGALGYALDNKTDFNVEYSYSESSNGENNAAAGLPLGLDSVRHAGLATLSRRLNEHLTARVRYGYYYLRDDSQGGTDDYTAHLISGSCTLQF